MLMWFIYGTVIFFMTIFTVQKKSGSSLSAVPDIGDLAFAAMTYTLLGPLALFPAAYTIHTLFK